MKALALFSGGLDSILAIYVIREQGLEVEAINVKTTFFGDTEKIHHIANRIGVKLHVLDVTEEFMNILRNPRYGYGKFFNPCIDCHAFMIKKTGELMSTMEASFIITGEVLGQRPMSQNKASLKLVEKLSGMQGLIVRPLSGRLLEPTIPEINGWINREKLLDIQGRSRKQQIKLAQHYKIDDYIATGSGCLLTMEDFSERLRFLFSISPQCKGSETQILKYGRFIPLEYRAILIIGRNEQENQKLETLAEERDYLFQVTTYPGPISLLRPYSSITDFDIQWAGSITAGYGDAKDEQKVNVRMWRINGEEKYLIVTPLKKNEKYINK